MKQTKDNNRGIIASILGVLAFVFFIGVISGKVLSDKLAHRMVYSMDYRTTIIERKVNGYKKTIDSIKFLYKDGLPKQTTDRSNPNGVTNTSKR